MSLCSKCKLLQEVIMNISVISKILSHSRNNWDKGTQVHFSFFIRRNKIVCIGKNNRDKTHPKAKAYFSGCIHSELSAILKFPHAPKELKKMTLVNVRIKKNGELGLSFPCSKCQTLLRSFGIDEAMHTTDCGSIVTSSF